MNKYKYHIEMSSVNIGEVEAESEDEAQEKALEEVMHKHDHNVQLVDIELLP